MQTDNRLILAVALVAAIGFVLGLYMLKEPQRQALAVERQQQEAAERGQTLYASLCSKCHGSTGEGAVGPAIAGDKYLERNNFKRDNADDLRRALESMRKAIARGRFNTAMPAWQEDEGGSLNQEQVQEIATFLLHGTAADSGSTPAGGAASDASDEEAGKALYASKGCLACHGPAGEGGVGPAVLGKTENEIFAQVRRPRDKMPPYAPGTLSDDDLRRIVRFIESLGPSQ